MRDLGLAHSALPNDLALPSRKLASPNLASFRGREMSSLECSPVCSPCPPCSAQISENDHNLLPTVPNGFSFFCPIPNLSYSLADSLV